MSHTTYKLDDLLYQALKSQTKRFLIANLIPKAVTARNHAGCEAEEPVKAKRREFNAHSRFIERVKNNLNFILPLLLFQQFFHSFGLFFRNEHTGCCE